MIFQNRNKVPFIHFGFNSQSKTVAVGNEVIIWQTQIYNPADYDPLIIADGSPTVVTEGLNKSVLTFGTAGSYAIRLDVSTKDKRSVKQSNILSITVT